MEHKYIFLKDSDGYENLWRIIHETNGVYAISRCETMSVVLKDACFNKGGSILYGSVVRDFETVVEKVDITPPYSCYNCEYRCGNEGPFDLTINAYEFNGECSLSDKSDYLDSDILSLELLREYEYKLFDEE